MATSIASLAVKLTANAAGLSAGLAGAAARVKSFASQINSVSGTLMQFAGGLAIAKFASQSIAAFESQEKALAKLEAVLRGAGGAAGFTSEQLQKMAADMQQVTVFGDEVVMNAQAILLAFGNIRGDVFRGALMAAADLATHLGVDLTDAAQKVGRALADPERGLRALSQAGVIFTEQEREVIRTLNEAGRAAEVQQMILAKMADMVGGEAVAAASTLSGQLQQMKNRIGDLQESIGARLMPLMLGLFTAVERVVAGIVEWQSVIVPVVAGIVGLVAALKALSIGLAVVQALSGPKGWATLAVGVAAAAGAVAMVSSYMDEVTASSQKAAASVGSVGESFKRGAGDAKALAQQLDELDDAQKESAQRRRQLESRAEALTKSLRTPIEVYRDSVAEADEMLAQHLITVETWQRAVAKAAEEFKQAAGQPEPFRAPRQVTIGAAVRGTVEGVQAVAAGRHQLDVIAKFEEHQLREARRQTELQKQMLEALNAPKNKVVNRI